VQRFHKDCVVRGAHASAKNHAVTGEGTGGETVRKKKRAPGTLARGGLKADPGANQAKIQGEMHAGNKRFGKGGLRPRT